MHESLGDVWGCFIDLDRGPIKEIRRGLEIVAKIGS